MMGESEQAASYEALCRELMRKPVPREGFILPKRPIDLLRRGDEDIDPYERWLAGGAERLRAASADRVPPPIK